MRRKTKALLAVLGVGITYYMLIRFAGFSIPCIFHKITGWKCPGCGITTLILCLLEGDFKGAFAANPFLFVTGPALLAELGYYYLFLDDKRKLPTWNNRLIILYGISLLIFGILRNL